MGRTKTATACLLLAGLCLAEPRMQVGTKATWATGGGSSGWFDTSGALVAGVSYGESFVGPTIEAVYGPLWGLSGRVDLAQLSVFLKGGAAFRLFPMLGLDVMLEPPVTWRLKPYVWAGARLVGYAGMSETTPPMFQHDTETHWRAGLGGKFRLTRGIELFAETRLFTHDEWWDGVSVFPDGSFLAGCSGIGVIGLVSAELGVRFSVDK